MIKGKFYTNDGELVFIEGVEDLKKIIKEQICFEAAEMIQELADLADSTKQRLHSDLISYESQIESQYNALKEIEQHTYRLLNLTHRAKIAKEYKESMLKSLEVIRKEVSNHL